MPRDIPVGNGSLLINFDAKYQLRDIYWPYVGQENHTAGEPCRFGVWVDGQFSWIDSPEWQKNLVYLKDTLVTKVTLFHPQLQLKIVCMDSVDFHVNIYLKKIIVHNLSTEKREVRLFWGQDFSIDGRSVGDSAYYEPDRGVLFHYKGRRWFLVGVAKGTPCSSNYSGLDQWAVGIKGTGDRVGTWLDAEDGILSGNPVAQGSVDSVVALHLQVPPRAKQEGWYWICVGEDYMQVTKLQDNLCKRGADAFLTRTKDYWRLWANKEKDRLSIIGREIETLYRRSLLILRSQIDNNGAILAANDFDITDFNNDTYSYMWPRDGALVTSALIDAGYSEIARRFFRFCHDAVTAEGYLLHKYNPDGSLASSWHGWYKDGEKQLPIQEDETALVIWAFWKHFERFRDIEFIKVHYRGLIIRAANWMLAYRDEATGLPLPSWDLWEERRGVHCWTVGAVWAGLEAAASFARSFGQLKLAERYSHGAAEIKKATEKYLWSEEKGYYARTITFSDTGELHVDTTLDASLVGLWYFGMFAPDDPKIVATMKAVQQRLWVKTDVGGIARYEDDHYHQMTDDVDKVPGNPWFISTLWLAQWHIAIAKDVAELQKSLEAMHWVAGRTLESGVMAEQVDPFTNEPLSVSPLTWSHATFVQTALDYLAQHQKREAQAQ